MKSASSLFHMNERELNEFLALRAGIELQEDGQNLRRVDNDNVWNPKQNIDQTVLTWKSLDQEAIEDMRSWIEMIRHLRVNDPLSEIFYEATINQFTIQQLKKTRAQTYAPFPSRDCSIWDFIHYKPTSFINSLGRKIRISEKFKEMSSDERQKIIDRCQQNGIKIY